MFCGRKQTTWMVAEELLVYLGSDLEQKERNVIHEMLSQMQRTLREQPSCVLLSMMMRAVELLMHDRLNNKVITT